MTNIATGARGCRKNPPHEMMVAKPEKAEGLTLRLPKIKASLTNKTANRRQAQQKKATTNTAPGFGMSSVDFSKPSMLSDAPNDKGERPALKTNGRCTTELSYHVNAAETKR